MAEPIDVPAIDVPTESQQMGLSNCSPTSNICNGSLITICSNGGTLLEGKCVGGHKIGCKDKSSILLSSEDGKHWCHKVQP